MTREEAINLIKQVLPCLNIDEKIREGFVTLIPELKESEDERIRKELIDFFDSALGKDLLQRKCGLNPDTVLAYLEKEKESVNLSYSDIETIQTALRVSGLEFSANREAYEKLEGQKEHKPAERNKATIDGEPIPTENQSVNIALSKEEKERIRQNGRLDVCYNPEKYGLCHKTEEWSEGEMKVLDSIIDDYEKAAKSFCGYDGKITLLKAIRDGEYVLPKQEWSEEDEQTFINSVETLEYLGKFELANWLKDHKNQFLKPQNTWKPSNWRISRGNGKKR